MADKKVVDVAGPSDAKVDIGSKPMIVGHKSMATDPMVRAKELEKTENIKSLETDGPESEEKKLEAPSEIQKTIKPISEPENGETDTNEKVVEAEKATVEDVEAEKTEVVVDDVKTKDTTETPVAEINNSGEKEAEIDPTALAMEQEENLRKIIESKKYNVSIKQARGSGKNLVYVAIAILILSLAGLFVAIDTNKLNLGFELPFSIFGNDNDASPEQQTEESIQNQSQQIPEEISNDKNAAETDKVEPILGFSRFTQEEIGFSFDFPDSWGQIDIKGDNGLLSSDTFLVNIYDRKSETKSSLNVEVRGNSESVDLTNSDSRYAKGFVREGDFYFEKAALGEKNAIASENVLASYETSLGEIILVKDVEGIGNGPSLKIYVNLPEGSIMSGLTLSLINSAAGEIGSNQFTNEDLENMKLVAQTFSTL